MVKRVLTILVLFTSGFFFKSCQEDMPGPFQIVTGDLATVSVFLKFDSVELEQKYEYIEDGYTQRIYSKLVDLNNDGSGDLNFVYEYHDFEGEEPFYFSFIQFHNKSLQLIGETKTLIWGNDLLPKLLSEGEVVRETSQDWMTFETNNPTHIYYSGVFNTFSSPPEDRYLLFKLIGEAQQTTIGWLHLKQTLDNWELQILDLGYKTED